MPEPGRTPNPFEGKTYSLVGEDGTSNSYFVAISRFVDEYLGGHTKELESILYKNGCKLLWVKDLYRLTKESYRTRNSLPFVDNLQRSFGQYTTSVNRHRKDLPLSSRLDRTLNMTEQQYHRFMLEIEILNRLHVARFRRTTTRLAFLPHCLKDLSADCRSSVRGEDYVCKGCSTICLVNLLSKTLRRHGVVPYIWMSADIPSLIKRLKKEGRSIGVLGIACIPELVHGMRATTKLGVPTVGIPLDANRCARWWGEFYPNTVNIRELERLLGDETLLTKRTRNAEL